MHERKPFKSSSPQLNSHSPPLIVVWWPPIGGASLLFLGFSLLTDTLRCLLSIPITTQPAVVIKTVKAAVLWGSAVSCQPPSFSLSWGQVQTGLYACMWCHGGRGTPTGPRAGFQANFKTTGHRRMVSSHNIDHSKEVAHLSRRCYLYCALIQCDS